MNKRPLIITSLIILLIAAAAIVISNLNSTTYTVTCKSKEEGCSYSHKSSSGKVLLSKDFKYEDVMQCNLETPPMSEPAIRPNVAAAVQTVVAP